VTLGWHEPAIAARRERVGSITHLPDDERYRWLNDVVCALTGEVRPREDGEALEVVLDVAELVWESLEHV
jgi:hypothetical protein